MPNPEEYIATGIDLAELCKTARPSEIARKAGEAIRRRVSDQITKGTYRQGYNDDYAVLHNQIVGREDF